MSNQINYIFKPTSKLLEQENFSCGICGKSPPEVIILEAHPFNREENPFLMCETCLRDREVEEQLEEYFIYIKKRIAYFKDKLKKLYSLIEKDESIFYDDDKKERLKSEILAIKIDLNRAE